MKLRISAKLASVHSEVNVTDLEEKTVFTTKTDPLSAPRCTRLYDAEGAEFAHYETTRTDEKDRAYSVSIDGGVSFTTKRSFRVSGSTCEAIIKVSQTGWTVLTQRAWSSRFEVHSGDGKVLVRAKQVPALRGDVYDIEILDEGHLIEMVLLSLIARSVIRDDAPIPV